jgi:hypothetical protein
VGEAKRKNLMGYTVGDTGSDWGKDPDGRIVYHHRTVDTLGKMLRAGTIDQAMHDAARDFQAAFIVAQLEPLRALPILRVPGTGREPDLSEKQLDARRRVHEAMQALGGISSPAGRASIRSLPSTDWRLLT